MNGMIYQVTWTDIDNDDEYEIESFDYEDEALEFAKDLRSQGFPDVEFHKFHEYQPNLVL